MKDTYQINLLMENVMNFCIENNISTNNALTCLSKIIMELHLCSPEEEDFIIFLDNLKEIYQCIKEEPYYKNLPYEFKEFLATKNKNQ